jgi:hypothetical protein
MATMYCALCRRPVEANRQVGVGTVILAVLTFGMSLLAVPFYRKRCCICRSAAVSVSPPAGAAGATGDPFARVADLEKRLSLVEGELETAGVELRQLKAERDFYSQLLANPAAREAGRPSDR